MEEPDGESSSVGHDRQAKPKRRYERLLFPLGTEKAYRAWLKERAAFWGNLRQPEPAGGTTSGFRRLA